MQVMSSKEDFPMSMIIEQNKKYWMCLMPQTLMLN